MRAVVVGQISGHYHLFSFFQMRPPRFRRPERRLILATFPLLSSSGGLENAPCTRLSILQAYDPSVHNHLASPRWRMGRITTCFPFFRCTPTAWKTSKTAYFSHFPLLSFSERLRRQPAPRYQICGLMIPISVQNHVASPRCVWADIAHRPTRALVSR